MILQKATAGTVEFQNVVPCMQSSSAPRKLGPEPGTRGGDPRKARELRLLQKDGSFHSWLMAAASSPSSTLFGGI